MESRRSCAGIERELNSSNVQEQRSRTSRVSSAHIVKSHLRHFGCCWECWRDSLEVEGPCTVREVCCREGVQWFVTCCVSFPQLDTSLCDMDTIENKSFYATPPAFPSKYQTKAVIFFSVDFDFSPLSSKVPYYAHFSFFCLTSES